MYPANKDRTFILKVYERRWAVHYLRCNGKAIFQIHRGFKGDIIVCLFLFSLVKCARMPVDTGKTPRLAHLDVSILPGVGFPAKNQTMAIKRCCPIWLGLQGFTDKLLNLLHMLKWYLKHTEDDWILNNVLQ